MGILNQSLKHNNNLYWFWDWSNKHNFFLYPYFLYATYYALTNYILSASSIVMPFGFGMQNTLVKFYLQCKTEDEQDRFYLSVFFSLYYQFLCY
jgi:hypothetical protein